MPLAHDGDSELGLSLARRLHGTRRLPFDRSNMTSSTSSPLRSVTARPLAHIAAAAAPTATTTTTTTTTTTSSAETVRFTTATTAAALSLPGVAVEPMEATAIKTSAEDPSLSASMRSFAVIVCNDCMYLEFPGCDVHGVLYTERAPPNPDDTTDSDGASPILPGASTKFHAKCPKCTAATNNVRPFREGCRRCKAPTVVHMWCSTLSEIAQAHEAFPTGCEEMEHSALTCELCHSVVFPRARGSLTKRTASHAMASANGKLLKVSNYQRSMPHVEGCPRKGMPSQTIGVQLTKSELKFVLERLAYCPFTTRIIGGPQYRKRKQQVVLQQNNLHQIYLRLLSTIVQTFDPTAANAIEPLQKIVALFERMEPLALFHEWSPHHVLCATQHKPTRVEASSILDDQHCAENVLSSSPSTSGAYWRPATSTATAAANGERDATDWLQFVFHPPVAIACVELHWHVDHIPASYSLVVTTDDGKMETVAVVVDRQAKQIVPFAQRSGVISVRVTVFPQKTTTPACALASALFYEAGVGHQVSNESIVHDLQQWLLRASLSQPRDDGDQVRDAALVALQHVVLASGSLCGLLQLATSLLVNASPVSSAPSNNSNSKPFDDQDWHRLDKFSPSARREAKQFVMKLAQNAIKLMVTNDTPPQAGENSLVEKHVLDQMVRMLEQPPSSPSPIPSTTTATTSSGSGRAVPSPKAVGASSQGEQSDSPLYPYISMAACQETFSNCITRRSQLGMVVLMVVSELSAWQMKRMQKAEEYAAHQKDDQLMQLEEPFSLEVRPALWDLAQRLLSHVLASWVVDTGTPSHPRHVSVDTTTAKREDDDEQKHDDDGGDAAGGGQGDVPSKQAFDHEVATSIGGGGQVDLYEMLTQSFHELGESLSESGYVGSFETNRKPTFSPDTMCVSILQIIASNIRRLVLSRVDPMEIGIEPAVVHDDSDLLSAPPALEPMVATLEQLISLGTKRSDKFFSISLKAAAAVEVGMEAFYPSAHQRTKLLTSRMGKGATLEVQVRWPVQERDQEDPRYERLLLMLQFECIKMGVTHAIRGRWQFFMHLIVQVPPTQDAADVLHHHFAPCIQQAGFASWQVVAGAQEISINLQRHLHWNRVEKMSHDSGAGWIRVYPQDVAIFDDVLSDVDLFLSDHDKRSTSKAATSRP